jgi:hypothetical protein
MKRFKRGEWVTVDSVSMQVVIKQGIQCLKYPGVLGYIYVVPDSWNDVKKQN